MEPMARPSRYSPEVRERAVRMVREHGAEPICRVLPIAPSTYFRCKAEQRDPTRRSARAQRDEILRAIIRRLILRFRPLTASDRDRSNHGRNLDLCTLHGRAI